jgi:uncharacterized lipoprotein YehR (DUF1307 family)
MRKYNILFLITTSTILYGCNSSWNTTLYAQRIEGTNKTIYEYDAWGGRDTHLFGYAILDASKEFKVNNRIDLPGSYFNGKPRANNLKLIEIISSQTPTSEKDTILSPLRHYFKLIDGINAEVTEYNDTYGSNTMNTGLMRYEFDTLKETNDSLTFNNVLLKFGGTELPIKTTFAKGNIKIVDDSTGRILYISVKQFVKLRGEIYKPTKPLEIVKIKQ